MWEPDRFLRERRSEKKGRKTKARMQGGRGRARKRGACIMKERTLGVDRKQTATLKLILEIVPEALTVDEEREGETCAASYEVNMN